jgi:LuxR family maltose regulon positive regulatory protein
MFAQEGAPMAALLTRVRQALARGAPGASLGYVESVLRACADPTPTSGVASGPTTQATPLASRVASLVEPLTDRELEVLRLIADGLGNAAVARTLYVAPSTVKSHVNHVFTKLGVASRTQAVARARELGLL